MTDQGWVKAGELHEGSKVLNSRKEYEVVESIEYKGYNEIEVYNLIVENYHTFFITELGLMVHNIDCKNATLGQIFKQVGDNISDTKIKGDFEDVIKKLDDIAGRNNIEEYIKNFDSRFRGLDPNNLDEIKKIISDTSKDIDNHSSSLFKGIEWVSNPNKLLATEGDVGTYKYLRNRGKIGDNITPHHMPSKEYMKQQRVKMNDGVSINMEQPSPGTGGRHRLTQTYGRNMTDIKKQTYYDLSPRDALSFDIKDLRRIYKEQGLYTLEVRKGLMDVIKLNKELYPELFNK